MPRRDNVFVVGCQRSGTSVVWAGLTAHPELKPKRGYDPETGYDPKELYYFRNIFAARSQFNSPLYGWPVDVAYLRTVVDLTIKHCVEHHGSQSGRFVNANPSDGLYIEELLDTMPEARIVYVLRHPEEVVWSAIHAPWADPGSRQRADVLRQHASHWREHAMIAKQVVDNCFGEAVLLVRHEDLVEDPERIARALAAHVGVDENPVIAEKLSSPTFNSSFQNNVSAQTLVSETRRAISRARAFRRTVFDSVGAEMEILGYADLGNPPLVARRSWKAAFSMKG